MGFLDFFSGDKPKYKSNLDASISRSVVEGEIREDLKTVTEADVKKLLLDILKTRGINEVEFLPQEAQVLEDGSIQSVIYKQSGAEPDTADDYAYRAEFTSRLKADEPEAYFERIEVNQDGFGFHRHVIARRIKGKWEVLPMDRDFF